MQLTINSFWPLFHDKIFPWYFPDFYSRNSWHSHVRCQNPSTFPGFPDKWSARFLPDAVPSTASPPSWIGSWPVLIFSCSRRLCSWIRRHSKPAMCRHSIQLSRSGSVRVANRRPRSFPSKTAQHHHQLHRCTHVDGVKLLYPLCPMVAQEW